MLAGAGVCSVLGTASREYGAPRLVQGQIVIHGGRVQPWVTAGSAEPGQESGTRPVMRPAARQLGRFRRPRRRVRAGLVQLLCVLAGLGLGLLLPRISTEPSVSSTRLTEALVTVGFGTL